MNVMNAKSYLGSRRRLAGVAALLVAFTAGLAVVPTTPAPAVVVPSVPAGFTDALVASGMSWPTSIAVADDGRVFVDEQGGAVRVVKNGVLLPTPFVKLTVRGGGGAANEEGLVGLTLDPNFATNHFLYVYYTVPTSGNVASHNRVSRLTANGDVAQPGSEKVLLEVPGPSSGAHNSGGLHFGIDGKLYVSVGDHSSGANGQSMSVIKGKILRINPDGSIPNDNPFFNTATGQNRAIWALGLRNPFRFGIQPGTGKILINDVGNGSWEEINLGVPGANYGWNVTEGPTTDPRFTSPLFAYPHQGTTGTVTGCAIVGGTFYNPTTVRFPSFYVGKYFFSDYCKGWIRVLDPLTGTATNFATNVTQPVDMQVGNDGALYYLDRLAGAVRRITYNAAAISPSITGQPTDRTVAIGQDASFTVSAEGTAPLAIQWQRDDTDIPGATDATYTLPTSTLADSGATFHAVVTNAAGTTTSHDATLTVVDASPPTAEITAPATYRAGDNLTWSGTAFDSDRNPLPPNAFTWRVDFHHDEHFHPFVLDTPGVTSGAGVTPTVTETSADVWFRVHLTVTDSLGLTTSIFRDVLPETVNLNIVTDPPGLQVRIDGPATGTPANVPGVVGVIRTIGVVSPQTVGNQTYVFSSWSHGGNASQDIQTPAVDTTYTANFVAADTSAFSDSFDRPDSPDIGAGWLEVNGDFSITSQELRNAPVKKSLQLAVVPTFNKPTQTADARFATINGSNSGPRFGLVLRYQDPLNYYLVSRLCGATSVLQISKVVNGTETVLKSKALPNPAPAAFFRLQGQATGSTLTLSLDGVAQLSFNDPTFATGSVGIAMGVTSTTIGQTHRADEFTANGT